MQVQTILPATPDIPPLHTGLSAAPVNRHGELKAMVVTALKELSSDPKMIASFAAFMKNFHNYSLYNRLLIFCQRPTATQVAGFRTWKRFGRYVRKGEQGIRIFAPILRKDAAESEAEREEEHAKKLRGYRVVSVFDYEQTVSIDGTDIKVPPCGVLVVHNPELVYERLKRTAEEAGLKVIETNMDFSVSGSTNGNMIWINRLTELGERCSTILHEIAHVFLGHLTERIGVPRNVKEVEAELTAFLAGLSIGLPRGSYQYVKTWLQGGEPDDESVELAVKTADRIAGMIQNHENRYRAEIDTNRLPDIGNPIYD